MYKKKKKRFHICWNNPSWNFCSTLQRCYLCICALVHTAVCVGGCVRGPHHLSRGSTQQSLSAKSAECEAWCQMTNLRDKLHLKETFFIVSPSPLQLFPFIRLPISLCPLTIIHCVWWVLPNYSIYSNLQAEYNKTVFPLLLLLCVVWLWIYHYDFYYMQYVSCLQ